MNDPSLMLSSESQQQNMSQRTDSQGRRRSDVKVKKTDVKADGGKESVVRLQDCKVAVRCNICQSNNHPQALHQPEHHVKSSKSETVIYGEEKSSPDSHKADAEGLNISNLCTEICGKGFSGRSCARTLLVKLHPVNGPHMSKEVYAILDDQSNRSLEPLEDKEIRPEVRVTKTEVFYKPVNDLFGKYSSWIKLASVVSCVIRAAERFKDGIRDSSERSVDLSPLEARRRAECLIIKKVQNEAYGIELGHLSNNYFPKNSSVIALAPISDEDGILRVGGEECAANGVIALLIPLFPAQVVDTNTRCCTLLPYKNPYRFNMWKITLFLALVVCLMFTVNVDALASQKNQEIVDFDGQRGNSGMEILLLYFLMNGMNQNQQQQKKYGKVRRIFVATCAEDKIHRTKCPTEEDSL
ncbi:hypothetical protein ScPMuIL_004788 [Solemya velum]